MKTDNNQIHGFQLIKNQYGYGIYSSHITEDHNKIKPYPNQYSQPEHLHGKL
jgi:hypothetical protein